MNSELTRRDGFTLAEFFFAQKLTELFHSSTVDSYRVRLHNPKTILVELLEVLKALQQSKIANFDGTVGSVIQEAKSLLSLKVERHCLVFNRISEDGFLKVLSNLRKEYYLEAIVALKIVLSENLNYANVLFDAVKNEIDTLNVNEIKTGIELDKLDKFTEFLASELYSFGLSKQYLFHITKSLFKKGTPHSFQESFIEFRKQLVDRKNTSRKIYFRVELTDIDLEPLKLRVNGFQEKETVQLLVNQFKEFRKFMNEEPKRYRQVLGFQVESLDDYTAIKSAREQISEIRDLLKISYTQRSVKIFNSALIASGEAFDIFKMQSIHYRIDGHFDTSEDLYDKFVTKYNTIRENPSISRETKDKLKSAIRYFRLGDEAVELEQRYLNYWIGMEYIYSSQYISESTFPRIKGFFSKLHSLSYLRRNLKSYHEELYHFRIKAKMPQFDGDESCREEAKFYFDLHNTHLESLPLVGFRALSISRLLSDDALKKAIERHKTNVEQHLSRIYRVRNELVHEAAIKPNIEVLASNLKYYLFFTIKSLIDFFVSPPEDTKLQNLFTIDDFFLSKSLQYDNIMSGKKVTQALLQIRAGSKL